MILEGRSMRPILCVGQVQPEWYGPPEPDKKGGVRVILAVVGMLIVCCVVVAIIMYTMVSDLDTDLRNEPNVSLCQADGTSGTGWKVTVAGVSEARDLDSFKAVLMENGIEVDRIDPLREHTSTQLQFTDYSDVNYSADGKLRSGDYFWITCSPGKNYELIIIGRYSGNMRGVETWTT